MAQYKQTITLLTCCQSTLGYASKQSNTCADVEVVESRANHSCDIPFENHSLNKICSRLKDGRIRSEERRQCACQARSCARGQPVHAATFVVFQRSCAKQLAYSGQVLMGHDTQAQRCALVDVVQRVDVARILEILFWMPAFIKCNCCVSVFCRTADHVSTKLRISRKRSNSA
jgi:hypothetical protein